MLYHKKMEKSRHVRNIMWRHWKLTSLKNITIFEKKNLTETGSSNKNWYSSKISKSVTENMSVSLSRTWVKIFFSLISLEIQKLFHIFILKISWFSGVRLKTLDQSNTFVQKGRSPIWWYMFYINRSTIRPIW